MKAGSIWRTAPLTRSVSQPFGIKVPTVEAVHRSRFCPITLGLGPEVWRVLSKCHDMRNRTEYEGVLDVDERLVADVVDACGKVAGKIKELPPIQHKPK